MFENLSQYGSAAFWIMQAVVGVIFTTHGAAKLKNKSALMGGTVHGVIEIAAGLALVINQYAQYAAAIIADVQKVSAILFGQIDRDAGGTGAPGILEHLMKAVPAVA